MGKIAGFVVLGVIGLIVVNLITKNKANSIDIENITNISVDKKGENVYISDNVNQKVYKFNIASTKVENLGISPNPPFSGPDNIAVDVANNVYIYDGLKSSTLGNANNDMLRKIDKNGNVADFGKLIKPSSLDIRASPVRVDAKGNVYTTDTNGGLYVIDPTTYIARQIPIPKDLKIFRFIMDLDDAGNVYLTDAIANERTPFSFYKINIITGKINARFPYPDSGQLSCMKVDTLGENLYFSFYRGEIIYKVNFKSLEINVFATLDGEVQSLSTDENKNVYASSPSYIYKIDPSGDWKKIY
jgi:DNA-binding beta-propeller fold protein YncE